jgi:2-isopropylmalate synthase
MAVHTHPNVFPVHHELNIQLFYPLSRMVSELSGMVVQPNKAIVGRNAFLHESGIHQDGVLKNRQTYEIMTPESVGVTEIALVLGKHSGRNALRNRGAEMGYTLDDTSMQKVFVRFKALCDKKKVVCDEEIRALFTSALA